MGSTTLRVLDQKGSPGFKSDFSGLKVLSRKLFDKLVVLEVLSRVGYAENPSLFYTNTFWLVT